MSAFFVQVRNSTTGALDKARLTFSKEEAADDVEEQEDASWTEELSNYCPTLTFQQRLIGFASSFGLGYLIAFFSFRFFIRLVEGNALPFAINYTVRCDKDMVASSIDDCTASLWDSPIPCVRVRVDSPQFGHILQLLASMFLCGPKRQFR